MAPALKVEVSNEVKIEKGIPLPSTVGSRRPAWPVRAMEVGDSFGFDRTHLSAVRSAVTYERRVNPTKKFAVRTSPHEARCWRIS